MKRNLGRAKIIPEHFLDTILSIVTLAFHLKINKVRPLFMVCVSSQIDEDDFHV